MMEDIRYGKDTFSEHSPVLNQEMALDWIKHIDKWHPKDTYAQKEKQEMIKFYNIKKKDKK